jgi:hypothetical protein
MSCRRKLLLLLLLAVNGARKVCAVGYNNHAHSSALSTTSLSAAVMDASCKPRQHACTH